MMKPKNGLDCIQQEGGLDWESEESYSFINPRLPSDQIQTQLKALGDGARFAGSFYLLTSGTTADQASPLKWVVLSKSAFLKSAQSVNEALGSSGKSGDTWLHLLPDFHVGGLAIRARSHLSGAGLVDLDPWRVHDFIKSILKNQVTLISLVPAQIFDLCQNRVRCPRSVRTVLVGAGALAPALLKQARELGWPIRMTYAMTEASSSVALTPLNSSEFEILPHWEVRGGEAHSSDDLWLKGESLFTAYILSDSSGQVSVLDPTEDGWFKTSDRGKVCGRKLELLGRSSDLIKIGGEKVEMTRLNQILEGIRIQLDLEGDLTLLPVPDERLGHVVHLMTDQKITDSQVERVREIFEAQVLPFEKIRRTHCVDQIPRTTLGKILIQACLAKITDPESSR